MSEGVNSPFGQQLRALVAAFTFLTRLPVGGLAAHDLTDLSRSATYFPVVGLVVGLIGAAAFAVAQLIWSPLIAVVLSVAATVYATGAFHEDALADSLDGFAGGWTKEQVLAIMKDSRVGSYALIGVVFVVLAKIGALVSIHARSFGTLLNEATSIASALNVTKALIVAHVVSRWSSVWLIRTHAYVRLEEPGAKPAAGRPFVNATSNSQLVIATIFTLIVATLVIKSQAIAVMLASILVTWMAGRYFTARIGGITGDALGAANQFVELSVYLVLAARPLSER